MFLLSSHSRHFVLLFHFRSSLGSQKPTRAIKAKSSSCSKPSRATTSSSSSSSASKGDTQETIRSYLYSMHQVGITQVDESEVLDVSGYSRTDSTGYRNAVKALTKDLGHVMKQAKKMSLAPAGLDYIAQHGGVVRNVSAPTMEGHQAKLKAALEGNAKAPDKAVDAIWNVMMDGKGHAQEELLAVADYKRADSTGYREIMKWLKKLKLVEKQGKLFRFTDEAYRYGTRPN